MKNVKINRVGNTRFVNIPGVGVGMYSGMVGTFSAGNLSKTWEVEPEIVSGKEVVPYGMKIIWLPVSWNEKRGCCTVKDRNFTRKFTRTGR